MPKVQKKIKHHLLSENNLKINVLTQYDLIDVTIEQIKIKNSDKHRAVYKIQSNNETYCLKKVYYNEDHLLFIYSALEWFHRNGLNVPRFLPTISRSRYVNYEDMLFVLTPWIEGTKCDYDNILHLIDASRTLAHLHRAAEKFIPISGSIVKKGYENLYISINKHFNRILSCYNLAIEINDRFSQLFLSSFDKNIALAHLSMSVASSINFNNLTSSLCHGDYVNKNIILDKTKKLWLIDFDKCCLDFVAHDISYYLRRLLKRDSTKWDVQLALTCIKNYNDINPLTIDDLKYIVVYVSFPQKYWKISKDYYNSIAKCNKSSFCTIIEKVIGKTDYQLQFAKEFYTGIEETFHIKL